MPQLAPRFQRKLLDPIRAPALPVRGIGRSAVKVRSHFGELLQGRFGPEGPVALVTLPCAALWAKAEACPGPLALFQAGPQVLSLGQMRQLLVALQLPLRGRFVLRLNMLPGGGAGASTAALVALARAALQLNRQPMLAPLALARACLRIEGASDPLMFPKPARQLWASRQGAVLAALPVLPRGMVIGGHWGAPQRTKAQDQRFADISDLVAAWPSACQNLATLAQLSSTSAARNLALRGPSCDPSAALAAEFGALGYAIAHTGSARSFIFPASHIDCAGIAARLQAAGFHRIIRFTFGGADA